MRLMESLREVVETKRGQYPTDFLAEAAGIDDFAQILGSSMYRSLINAYAALPMPWKQYTKQSSVSDFRLNTRIAGSEAADLLPLGKGGTGPYQDSTLSEASYTIRAATKARMFSITRQALINDDLNYLKEQPTRFGRAAARTLTKDVVINTLEANLNAYDGSALFSVTPRTGNLLNLLNGSGTSGLTMANLNVARYTIGRSKYLGEYTGATAKYLIVPPELETTARQILNSETLLAVGVPTGAVSTVGSSNPYAGFLQLIVDPWLTSATAWYVLADPADVPVIEVAFLNGKQQPDLLIQNAEYRQVAGGGPDEFLHGEIDELRYAVRYDYGIAVGMFQGAFKGAGTP